MDYSELSKESSVVIMLLIHIMNLNQPPLLNHLTPNRSFMFFKTLPTLFLILAIAIYSWSVYLGGQSRFSKTVKSQTYEATSVTISWEDKGVYEKFVVESTHVAAHLADYLAETASLPVTAANYASQGEFIVFRKGKQEILEISCFTDNIIRMNGRYYLLSRDFFNKARVTLEEQNKSEFEQ